MKILALESSSAACSVAFLDNDQLSTRHEIIPLQHANALLAYIEELAGPQLAELDALAWGRGPGSFTGLRIAASVIQALAFAHSLPVISISSLAVLAQAAYHKHGSKDLLVAIDARMQEIYWARYQINSYGYAELFKQELLISPKALGSELQSADEGALALGDAWLSYASELQQSLGFWPKQIDAQLLPTASALAFLAKRAFLNGEGVAASHAIPMYLRENICKIS